MRYKNHGRSSFTETTTPTLAHSTLKTKLIIGLNAAIIAVTREISQVLTVKGPDHFLALPGEMVSEDGVYLDALPSTRSTRAKTEP